MVKHWGTSLWFSLAFKSSQTVGESGLPKQDKGPEEIILNRNTSLFHTVALKLFYLPGTSLAKDYSVLKDLK